ncbi:MAG TPA: sigma-70 family RNA polymerase sigma factor [Tepidisphaeraceae bacterium]|jgi:RNA polymerase sigma-70 factor (ECF subfamily)|nr:sigma-70 family RNA polymerase sigma factor [Tepidisphaeraceae bacterium]
METNTTRQNAEGFIQQYTGCQSSLRAFVLSLVPHWADAEEITQRCSLIMWKKFDQFQPGTNFFAWACKIARLEVKEYRKRQARQRVIFSDAFIDAVADEMAALSAELPARVHALQRCVEKLSAQNQELLRLHYEEGQSIQTVAQSVNRPLNAVYKAFSRVRQALHECIDRRLAAGDV